MKQNVLVTAAFIAALIAACGPAATPAEPTPDVAAVRTSAASTVVAQFTLTAAVFTPTRSLPVTEETASGTDATATETQPAAVQAVTTNSCGTPEALCDSLGYNLT